MTSTFSRLAASASVKRLSLRSLASACVACELFNSCEN